MLRLAIQCAIKFARTFALRQAIKFAIRLMLKFEPSKALNGKPFLAKSKNWISARLRKRK
jgi:hypothetical protein